MSGYLDDFNFFGVIKKTGVDDEGLMEFSNILYSFPLYRDVDLKVSTRQENLESPGIQLRMKFMKGLSSLHKIGKRRVAKQKEIEGNLIGEGLTKGGVVLSGKNGQQVYQNFY